MKNHALKQRLQDKPYEIWVSRDMLPGQWEWHVLKKWQTDDDKSYARWFCLVKSPFVPEGEMGDVYVKDIKETAVLAYRDPDYATASGLPFVRLPNLGTRLPRMA